MPRIESRLAELGLTLPAPAKAVAAYVPFVRTGNLVVIAGQLPMENGAVAYKGAFSGAAGAGLDIETGYKAAQCSALNVLAQLKAACGGDLDKVTRIVRLGGFIVSSPDFFDQPKVMNGASELVEKIFGEAGQHARTTVGVPALPLGACLEVEALVEIRD